MNGITIANLEQLHQVPTVTAHGGFGGITGIVATGTMVAICGYLFKASNAPNFVINNGADVNSWVSGLAAGGTMEFEFDYPLLLNGFGITHSGTAANLFWNVSYKLLGPV